MAPPGYYSVISSELPERTKMNTADIQSLAAQVAAQPQQIKFTELFRSARANAQAMVIMAQNDCAYRPTTAARAGLAHALQLVSDIEAQIEAVQRVFGS
jgi:hypothetical protein